MTKINLLDKRKKTLEQKKNRLKQLETSLNAQVRKKRTRKLIEIGGLAAKAHLEDWPSNTLLGAFLFLKEKESDLKQLKDWAHQGGTAFAAENDKNLSSRKRGAPVIVKFDSQPNEEVRSTLKSLGLKWNSLRKEWEGYSKVQELKHLLAPYNASIQELESSSEK